MFGFILLHSTHPWAKWPLLTKTSLCFCYAILVLAESFSVIQLRWRSTWRCCFWDKKAYEAVCLGNCREAGEASPTVNPAHDPNVPMNTKPEVASPPSLPFLIASSGHSDPSQGDCSLMFADETKLEETRSFATETNQYRPHTVLQKE